MPPWRVWSINPTASSALSALLSVALDRQPAWIGWPRLQPDLGVDPEAEGLLLTAQPIAQAPVLAAVSVDPQIQAAGVGQLANRQPLARGVLALRIGQH